MQALRAALQRYCVSRIRKKDFGDLGMVVQHSSEHVVVVPAAFSRRQIR